MHTYLTLYMIVMILFYRRRVEFRMLNEPSQSISSDDLTSLVSEIRSTTPYVGESLVSGRLRSLGYQVSRDRVHQALRSTDPLGSALRWPGGLTHRHPYSVAGPNSLWHIGNTLQHAPLSSCREF